MDNLPKIIRNRISLAEWIRKEIHLVRKGSTWLGLCPFHLEKTPSFSVNDQRFHCFGCGASGDLFDYVMEKRGLPFKDVFEELAAFAKVEIPEKHKPFKNLYSLMAMIQKHYHAALFKHSHALSYLENRQIHEESISIFSLGFGASLGQFLARDLKLLGLLTEKGIDRFLGRLLFPIHDTYGQVVGFGGRALKDDQVPKYYNTPETEFFHKRDILYGYHLARRHIKKNESFIMVEGYFDVIMMHQHGLKTAVGSMGTALSEEQIRLLWRHKSTPILCFDGDNAGMRAAYQAIQKAIPFLTGKQTFSFCLLPNKSDPDTFLREYGKENFINLKKYPLVDVLWQGICEQYAIMPSSTPEEKAYFETLWKDILQPMQDSSLKRFYGEEFLKRQRDLCYRLKKNTEYPLAFIKKTPIKDLDMRILLVTLLNHPGIFEDVFEALSYVNSEDPFLEKVKMNLLHKKIQDLDSASLMSEALYAWAPFARVNKSDTEALEGWTEVWERLMRKSSQDIHLACLTMKKHLSKEAWERFKNLKTQHTRNNKYN